MKIGDKVRLFKTTEFYPRGSVGEAYTIAEILKTEVKLCTSNTYCFYTHIDNVIPINNKSTISSTYPLNGSDYNIDKKHITRTGGLAPTGPRSVDCTTDKQKPKNEAFAANLDAVIKDISDLLKSKNKAYGNSALKPAKIFSQLDATESLCSRIDDKLMRIKNRGINDATEDTVDDLIGYLLLLKMSM